MVLRLTKKRTSLACRNDMKSWPLKCFRDLVFPQLKKVLKGPERERKRGRAAHKRRKRMIRIILLREKGE